MTTRPTTEWIADNTVRASRARPRRLHGTSTRPLLVRTRCYLGCMPRSRSASVGPSLPPLKLDESDPAPRYVRVARHIEKAVTEGKLRPGDRLDGELGLAERLGISRQTLRKAVEDLVARGILVRKHGVGTQVAPSPAEGRPFGVSSLYDELVLAGRHPETEVRILETQFASPEVAAALELTPGDEVVHLERIRFASATALAIMRNWLPAGFIDLQEADLQKRGLYEILREAGVDMRIAHQSIGAESATDEAAALLDVPKGAALLSMHTLTYADLGRPIELGQHSYRSDNFRFQITNVKR